MRRLSAALLLPLLTSGVVALPAVSVPSASAAPVEPAVRELAVKGIDRAALLRSPEPEEEAEPGQPAAELAPTAVTSELRSTPFSAVGVTWAADARLRDVAVQVRTRAERRWSAWTELEVQLGAGGDAATERSARAGSDLLYVGRSDAVQVRVDGGDVAPRDVRVALIDPGTSPADAHAAKGARGPLGGVVAHAAAPQPAYVSRRGWGADESLRNCSARYAEGLKGAILHTTATSNAYTAAQSPAVVRAMYAYHTNSLGWCDLGYNFVVDKFGTLYEGRAGGVDRPVIGTHTGGFNTATVGISMMGHHDQVAPSEAQLQTVARAFAWKLALHGVSPTGTTTYRSGGGSATKYPAGTYVTSPVISGHRDYSAKSCPGNLAYPLLPLIRSSAARHQLEGSWAATSPAATPTATTAPAVPAAEPGLRPATPISPATLTAGASPAQIVIGGTAVLRGRLTTPDGPVSSAPVEVYGRATTSPTWVRLMTLRTAGDGTFVTARAPRVGTAYDFRFPGDATRSAAGRAVIVAVAPVVRAGFSASVAKVGQTVLLRGTVSPAHAGQLVQRQLLMGGIWRNAGTTRLSRTGSYAFPVRWTKKGVRDYRVVKPSDADHSWAASPKRRLTVR